MVIALNIAIGLLCLFSLYKFNKTNKTYKINKKHKKVNQDLQTNDVKSFLYNYRYIILSILFIVGILVRIILFWDMPRGLNQDEASMAYDAYADLIYGMDRNGYHNPVYSVAWGSGHSQLYVWIMKPFLYLFGLNKFSARVPIVLVSCISLFAFYGIVKRIKDEKFAVLALFLLVINPWHIMMSRWALDCNMFPLFFVISTYFLVCGIENKKFYYLAGFSYGLTLYAYGVSYIVIPLFLAIVAIYFIYHKKIDYKTLAITIGIFVITVVPLGIFLIINQFDLEPIQLGFISFPKLISGRYKSSLGLNDGIMANVSKSFQRAILQKSGLIWNMSPNYGTVYLFSMPFALLGIISNIINLKKEKKFNPEFVLTATILPSILIMLLIRNANVNRLNFIFIPIIYFIAEGVYFICKNVKYMATVILTLYIISFSCFSVYYFTDYQERISYSFFDGAGEAMEYAAENTDGTLYFSNKINGAYIISMFYDKTDPRLFLDTVIYENPKSENRHVKSYGRVKIGINEESLKDKEAAFVIRRDEKNYVKDGKRYNAFLDTLYNNPQYEVKEFEKYHAIVPKK